MHDETFDTFGDDLDEARVKIEATRAALQTALDARDGDLEPVRWAIARLDRIVDDLARFEGAIRGRVTDPLAR